MGAYSWGTKVRKHLFPARRPVRNTTGWGWLRTRCWTPPQGQGSAWIWAASAWPMCGRAIAGSRGLAGGYGTLERSFSWLVWHSPKRRFYSSSLRGDTPSPSRYVIISSAKAIKIFDRAHPPIIPRTLRSTSHLLPHSGLCASAIHRRHAADTVNAAHLPKRDDCAYFTHYGCPLP